MNGAGGPRAKRLQVEWRDRRRFGLAEVVADNLRHARGRRRLHRHPRDERRAVVLADEGIVRLLLADRRHGPAGVVVARVHDGGVGQRLEAPERVEEVRGASSREIRSSRAAREQRIAREEMAIDQEGQGIRRVTGRIEHRHRSRPQHDRVTPADALRGVLEL